MKESKKSFNLFLVNYKHERLEFLGDAVLVSIYF